jgi:para-aminobenzoate synthetase component 1
VPELDITADELVSALLKISEDETVCVLDSCGVGYLDSHLLIAGVDPVEVLELSGDDVDATLAAFDAELNSGRAGIFTISYGLGQKLLPTGEEDEPATAEPDIFLALFETLLIHDYRTGKTALIGGACGNDTVIDQPGDRTSNPRSEILNSSTIVDSNFSKDDYIRAIGAIQEEIRCGNTYQTNLTRQLIAELPVALTPQRIFERLRRDHPAPFSAFISRPGSTVVSASPERFIRIDGRQISTSPIKGTRPRGVTPDEDVALRQELLASEKDRAENTMIVDLLRNDLGRVCEFGSVKVEKLCDLEEHPTFFHLVSTINGRLRDGVEFSDVLQAVFPCGSITGAPKISTMKLIDRIEPVPRGLSMGAIGYFAPPEWNSGLSTFDLSVAIRTMVIRGRTAAFNVGGGIVIDSEPEKEWDETVTKSQALIHAIGGRFV